MRNQVPNGKIVILSSGSGNVSYTIKYNYNGQAQDPLTILIPDGMSCGTEPIMAPIDNLEIYRDNTLVAKYPNGSLDHDNNYWGQHYMLKSDGTASRFWINWNPTGNAVVVMDDKITMVD